MFSDEGRVATVRIVMLTDDGRSVDRRILLEAETLADLGHEVIIVARNDRGDGIHADWVGRAKVIWIDYDLGYLAGTSDKVELPDPTVSAGLTEPAAHGNLVSVVTPVAPRPIPIWRRRVAGLYRRLDQRRRGLAQIERGARLTLEMVGTSGLKAFRLHFGIARVAAKRTFLDVLLMPADRVVADRQRRRVELTSAAVVNLDGSVPRTPEPESFEMNIWERAIFHRAVYFDPDVIHVHDLPQLLPAVLAARHCAVPVIYDAHEVYPEIGTLTPEQQESLRHKERALVPHCTQTITVNPYCAEAMERAYGCKPFNIVLNATQPSSGHVRGSHDDRLRQRLGLSPETRILMFQGWMADVGRGLLELVAGMAKVRPEVHLVMMGYGDIELFKAAATMSGVEDRVHLLPPVPWDQLVSWSAAADVGIIPYQPVDLNHRVCSPNKLFEFISAGLPILANDLPYLTKVIMGEGFGLTRQMETPEDMAAAVNEMFDPAGGHIARARRNMVLKGAQWEWPVQAEKIKAIYAQLTPDRTA
jgi:glycosyltransferase involved in cell wall biosynthesis